MKTKSFLVTVLTLLCFATTGFAASGNAVDMKTDVPTIPISACDRAGFISFEIGDGFTMTEGDIIQLNLTNKVVLCKTINYYLLLTDAVAMGYDQTAITTGAPIVSSNAANAVNTDTLDGITGLNVGVEDVGFLVTGAVGSSRVQIQLVRRTIATGVLSVVADAALTLQVQFDVGLGDPSDVLTVTLFDMKDRADTVAVNEVYFAKDDPLTTAVVDYLDPILATDNTICIDTDDPEVVFSDGQYVRATPQSVPANILTVTQTPLTFSGDSTVATISGSTGYTVDAVGKGTCPTVTIDPELDQNGNPIAGSVATYDMGSYVDPCAAGTLGLGRWQQNATNICANDENVNGAGRGIIVSRTNAYDATEQIRITLSAAIMDNGASSYSAAAADTAWVAAATAAIYMTANGADGNTNCAVAKIDLTNDPNAGWAGTNDLTTGNLISMQTGWMTPGNMTLTGLATDRDSIMIDPNSLMFDKSKLDAGDTVAWAVTVERYPCGIVTTDYVCAFVAESCDTDATASYQLLFPYGVGADNVNFWTGIAVTNLSDTAGTATATFYGTEGGMGTYTFAVGANDIETFAMSSISPTGTLTGAENFYVIVDTDFETDGLMFVGGKGANAGVLHGYLPRN